MDLFDYFLGLPAESRPLEVAGKLARLFLRQEPDTSKHYKTACAWYGSLKAAALLKDEKLLESLIDKYAPFHKSFDSLLSGSGHVDESVFGIVALEISKHKSIDKYRNEGLAIAEHQYKNIDKQIRCAIDDMFMITALQVQAYRVSGEIKYLDLAATVMTAYLMELQQEDGLFFHHKDFRHRWCRGNGWAAAGMAELLSDLPPNSPHYPEILGGFQKMTAGLLKCQIAEGQDSGLWKQIVNSNGPGNWAETSGSAMFCFALIKGLGKKLLDLNTYAPATKNAWLALTNNLTPEGQLRNISNWAYKPESHPESANKYDNDEENYYFEREKLTGDNHGQAPMLWAATELIPKN